MKVAALTLILTGLFTLALAGTAASENAPPSSPAPSAAQTMKGQFRWTQADEVGELQASFTPTGAASWNVSFRFEFRGPHTYTGTAAGTLAEGSQLSGEVQDEKGRRHWKFAGTFKNGRLDGEHFELRGGEQERSGTLTLFR